ncbi:MAG TPA: TetR family transcriptional regulator, partial [Micromonosporaceae bacterium]
MPRPRHPILTRERIIRAATTILDQEGLDALSTRRLAAEMHVRAPSLYNHFRTKDEILDAVADAIIDQVEVAMLRDEPWPTALREFARAYRAALVARPNIVPFLARGPGLRPAALRLANEVYLALVDAGWPISQAIRISTLLRNLVAGSALGSSALGCPADAAGHEHDSHHVDDGAFELGLELLVKGL